jgi:hypothetical protein
MLLVEHLTDLHHVVCTTDGCVDFLREAEGLGFLAMPPGGSNTRWPYWIDLAVWLAPATERYENILRFLLHTWLVAQGNKGIGAGNGGDSTQPALDRAEIIAKIKLITNDTRREFLEEMCDPAIRIWLIFLTIYGRMSDSGCSMKRFLNYTQNDKTGTAFKAGRVVRSRLESLDAIASEDNDPLLHGDFEELRTFVETNRAVYTDSDAVRKIVRKGASQAAFYFRGASGEDSVPVEQRALRWLNFVPLLVLGLMDDKGAVTTARSLLKLKRQGVAGYAVSMLPYMPSGLKRDELEKAILDAKSGPCVACQPRFDPLLEKVASMPECTILKDLFDDNQVGELSCDNSRLW